MAVDGIKLLVLRRGAGGCKFPPGSWSWTRAGLITSTSQTGQLSSFITALFITITRIK